MRRRGNPYWQMFSLKFQIRIYFENSSSSSNALWASDISWDSGLVDSDFLSRAGLLFSVKQWWKLKVKWGNGKRGKTKDMVTCIVFFVRSFPHERRCTCLNTSTFFLSQVFRKQNDTQNELSVHKHPPYLFLSFDVSIFYITDYLLWFLYVSFIKGNIAAANQHC